MSLDGMAVRALAHELNERLHGARIDKIIQPTPTSVVLHCRKDGRTLRLLTSINPQNARMAISDESFQAPAQAPLFCMVLRKHLQNAQIEHVRQRDWERILEIRLCGRSEIGDETELYLLAELMGKSSNLLLLDDGGTILDACRRVGVGVNQYRQIQPGLAYVPPPAQDKLPLESISEDIVADFVTAAAPTRAMRKVLLDHVAGLGPQTVQELLFRAGIDPQATNEYLGIIDMERLTDALLDLRRMAEQASWQPTMLTEAGEAIAFAPFRLSHLPGEPVPYPGMSSLLEAYYQKRERAARFDQKRGALERLLHHEIARCEKKLHLQLAKIDEVAAVDIYRLYGELLTANLYQVKQGPTVTLPNYYEANAPLEIPMDPTKTPNDNAQAYFKKYNRAKNGAVKAAEQAERTQEELDYLLSVLDSLDNAERFSDLDDVRSELEDAGYAKRRPQKDKRRKDKAFPEPSLLEVDGFQIYVGKNNRQNDRLTTKIARGKDRWFHTKEIHGAHVVIKQPHDRDIPDEILTLAAELAAYFSKARHSAQVPVDMTEKRHVSKPSGARPGMVIYTHQTTLFVTPDEDRLRPYLSALEPGGEHAH